MRTQQAPEHAIHGIRDVIAARVLRTPRAYPGFELGDERSRSLLVNRQPQIRWLAVDLTVDPEQLVDPIHRRCCDRHLLEVGVLEKFAAASM